MTHPREAVSPIGQSAKLSMRGRFPPKGPEGAFSYPGVKSRQIDKSTETEGNDGRSESRRKGRRDGRPADFWNWVLSSSRGREGDVLSLLAKIFHSKRKPV